MKLRRNLAVPLFARKTAAIPTSLCGKDFTTYLSAELSSFNTAAAGGGGGGGGQDEYMEMEMNKNI